jgi:hypothetical protein
VKDLLCKIECLRQRMHVIALNRGIGDPEVLTISKKLDTVINDYYNKNVT